MQPLDVTTDDSYRSFLPGMAQEDDRSLVPEFFVQKKLMGAKSEALNREVYEDREYVKITIKGQPHGQPVHEVDEKIKHRFPIAYARFKAGLPAPAIGTPVEQLSGVGPSLAHHLKGLMLRTVEDLANVSDENTINRIGGGARDLVNRAKAWIEQKAPETVALQEALAAAQAATEAATKRAEEVEARAALDRAEWEKRISALEKGSPKRKKRRVKKGGAKNRPAAEPQVEE